MALSAIQEGGIYLVVDYVQVCLGMIQMNLTVYARIILKLPSKVGPFEACHRIFDNTVLKKCILLSRQFLAHQRAQSERTSSQ